MLKTLFFGVGGPEGQPEQDKAWDSKQEGCVPSRLHRGWSHALQADVPSVDCV